MLRWKKYAMLPGQPTSMRGLVIGSIQVRGEFINVKVTKYNDGNLAVILARNGEADDMLSVNIPELADTLEDGEFFARFWSEHKYLREPAINSGLFEDTGKRAENGLVTAEVWRIK